MKTFEKNDLVWAKMKGFPPWPAKITFPEDGKIPKSKKDQHYVYFFGTHDHAWIQDHNVEAHSDSMLTNTQFYKKMSGSLLAAIQEIKEACKAIPSKAASPTKIKSDVCPPPTKKPKKSTTKLEATTTSSDTVVKNKVESKVTASGTASKPVAANRKSKSNGTKLTVPVMSPSISKFPKKRSHSNKVGLDAPSTSSATSEVQKEKSNVTEDDISIIPYSIGNDIDLDTPSTSGIITEIPKVEIKAETPFKKIGFLGLGAMGRLMVERLLSEKNNVTVWNRTNHQELDDLRKLGAAFVSYPMDVINECDVTLCCVSNSAAVRSVVYGKFGVLQAFVEGVCNSKAYVEMSTIEPSLCEEIAEAITSKGGKYLEATMLGDREKVASGKMAIVAAGDYEVYCSCNSPIFAPLSKGSVYLGSKVGQGNRMSAILQMFAGGSCVALSQIMGTVRDEGVSPDFFVNLVGQGPCNFPMVIKQAEAMISNDDTVHTPVKHQVKNLSIALAMGNQVNQALTLAVPAKDAFTRAMRDHSENDVSVIFKKMT